MKAKYETTTITAAELAALLDGKGHVTSQPAGSKGTMHRAFIGDKLLGNRTSANKTYQAAVLCVRNLAYWIGCERNNAERFSGTPYAEKSLKAVAKWEAMQAAGESECWVNAWSGTPALGQKAAAQFPDLRNGGQGYSFTIVLTVKEAPAPLDPMPVDDRPMDANDRALEMRDAHIAGA